MITGGQNLVSSQPAFSNDAKRLLVCTSTTVSVFSTATGMLITELEGHTERVTSIVIVPAVGPASKLMNYCWTSSLDGTFCYWDFVAPNLIKKTQHHWPIHSMVIPHMSYSMIEKKGIGSDLYAFIAVEDTSKPTDDCKALRGQIQMYNLTKSKRVGLLAETRNPEIIMVSSTGEYIGIRNKRKLHIWSVPQQDLKFDSIKKIKLHHTKSLTVLAFHPTERTVAGGDITGRILIWRDFGGNKLSASTSTHNVSRKNEEGRPGVRDNDDANSCSTWHWHPSAVKFLFFSSDGAYLYSGGNEGVLVVWQLETRKQKFKPRLGSPLLYYKDSPDPSLSCVSCTDNQIHLLKMPTMEITRSISGIKLPFSFPDFCEGLYSGITFESMSHLVILPTENYCVQFFNLLENREVGQIQICERNYQPVDAVTVAVARTVLSDDGSTMGTVEVKKPEEEIGGLVTLKFWSRGSRSGEFTLSTVIYEPHSGAGISSLAFRPKHKTAVSTSFGGDFKIWVHNILNQQTSQKSEGSGWRCQSVGSYKKRPISAAAFSADGSVLAVAAGTVVTLWDSDKNVLVTVIGDTLMPIVALSFIGKSEFLVTVCHSLKPQIAVWNLSTLSISWSFRIFVEAVACTEDGSQFAVLAILLPSKGTIAGGRILLFNTEDPIPAATWSVKKAKGGGLSFLPPNPSLDMKLNEETQNRLLAYMNSDHEFVVFDPVNIEENQVRSIRQSHAPEETSHYGYTSIYGELPEFDMKSEDKSNEITFVPSDKSWQNIFSGPSHLLPLPKLCSAFLESLLEKRPLVNNERNTSSSATFIA